MQLRIQRTFGCKQLISFVCMYSQVEQATGHTGLQTLTVLLKEVNQTEKKCLTFVRPSLPFLCVLYFYMHSQVKLLSSIYLSQFIDQSMAKSGPVSGNMIHFCLLALERFTVDRLCCRAEINK